MSEAKNPTYLMCHFCSHRIPLTDLSNSVHCDRCGHTNHRLRPKSARLTLAFSLTALIFYFPANIFPFMSIELYGSRSVSTIWGGIVSLADDGAWVIAIIIFLASILIPFLKLAVLFYLSATAKYKTHSRFKTRLYHVVEAIGRWSMLDIFLLAVLVAIIKMGPWTHVQPEVGSFLFALVVIFTMLASANFDPQLLWKQENDESSE